LSSQRSLKIATSFVVEILLYMRALLDQKS